MTDIFRAKSSRNDVLKSWPESLMFANFSISAGSRTGPSSSGVSTAHSRPHPGGHQREASPRPHLRLRPGQSGPPGGGERGAALQGDPQLPSQHRPGSPGPARHREALGSECCPHAGPASCLRGRNIEGRVRGDISQLLPRATHCGSVLSPSES